MPGEVAKLEVRVRVEGETEERPRLDLAFETTATLTAIMGPSGAGKSTLLQCIAGLVRPTRGRIALGDELLFDSAAGVFLPPHRRRIALAFQSLALFPHLRVWENVAYGLRTTARGDRRAAALGWLERVRVASLADRLPSTLSGGEAQRVALVRALASEPRLLLLDEPFSSLDQELRLELGEVLRVLLTETRVPTLLVTHDAADARRLASRLLVLQGGRLVTDETPAAKADLRIQ